MNTLSIRSLKLSVNGQTQLLVSGQQAQAYRLLTSADLITWRRVRRAVAPSDQFILVDVNSQDRAFYRIEPTGDAFPQ